MEDIDKKRREFGVQRWQKYEEFNYPIPSTNEQFSYLRRFFIIVKDQFFNMNNINQRTGDVDIVKMILDQNYNLFGKSNKKNIILQFRKE